MRRATYTLCLLSWLTACGGSSGERTSGDPEQTTPDPTAPSPAPPSRVPYLQDPVPSPVPEPAPGGQTGAGSPPGPCFSDAECEQQAQAVVELFTHPRPVTDLLRSECVKPDVAPGEQGYFEPGEVCACYFACVDAEGAPGLSGCSEQGEAETWIWRGSPAGGGGIDRWGHSYLEGYDFGGCDPARPEQSCSEVCEDFEARWHAAEARTYDVSIMAASCPLPGSVWCVTLFRADGQCYEHLGSNWGSEALQGGPFECSTCAASAQEVKGRVWCEQPVCEGAEPFVTWDDESDEPDAGGCPEP